MDVQDIITALEAARAVASKAESALGEHMLAGGDKAKGSALTKSLQKANAKVEEIEAKLTAVNNAAERAKQDRIAREEREAEKALAAKIDDARDALEAMRKQAALVDKTLVAHDDAMNDLGAMADEFIEKYRGLGLNSNAVLQLRLRSWCGEILAHMKNRGNRSMRNHLATRNLLTFGSEKIANQCVEAQIPDFATLMNVKRKAVA